MLVHFIVKGDKKIYSKFTFFLFTGVNKAANIEIAPDLGQQLTISAIRRFVSTSGRFKFVISDNFKHLRQFTKKRYKLVVYSRAISLVRRLNV